MRNIVLCLGLMLPGVSFGGDGLVSRVINGTPNQVCTSFVDEVRIEKRMVRTCDGLCARFECRDFAVTYRKKVWTEKVPTVECVSRVIQVNRTVCQCVNGCMVPMTVQESVVVNTPTVVGYTDRVIRFGIPIKVCEQPVAYGTVAPPLAQ